MFNVQELQRITGGKLIQGKSSVKVKGVSINSRAIKKGELFIAIAGPNFDGHQFVADAVAKKAAAVIVAKAVKGVPADIPVIRVKDTVKALGRIARAYRDRFKIPVVAVTGSAGKTTTKEMVADILSVSFKVLKNIATENNHIGVPLTLFKLRPAHDIAVIEVGTNRPGDIKWLTYIANPQAAILTNIGESHLELLKSPQGVFREKLELVKGMRKGGTVIVNADDRYLNKIAAGRLGHKVIRYALRNKADYRAGSIESRNGRLHFAVNGKKGWVISSLANHNIYNALASISCARYFQMSDTAIQKRLARFRPAKGRQQISRMGRCWLIDDTYNANPISLRSALQTLISLNTKGRKILVCGDMLELGKQSEHLHRSIGRLVAGANLDLLLTFGKMSRFIAQEAQGGNAGLAVSHCPSIEKINEKLEKYCSPGDAILVKGSRGMKMERIVDFLRKNLN